MLWFATHVTANSQEALVEEEDFCHGSVHILEITMKGGEVAQPEVGVVHVWRQLALGVHALLFIMAYMCYGSVAIVWRTAAWVARLWSTVSWWI